MHVKEPDELTALDPNELGWRIRTNQQGPPFHCDGLDELARRMEWLDAEGFTAGIPTTNLLQPLWRTGDGEPLQLAAWPYGRAPAGPDGVRRRWIAVDAHRRVEGATWCHALRDLVSLLWPGATLDSLR